jgi:hypothetical protein
MPTVFFWLRDNSFAVTKPCNIYKRISFYIGGEIYVYETLLTATPKIFNENDNLDSCNEASSFKEYFQIKCHTKTGA